MANCDSWQEIIHGCNALNSINGRLQSRIHAAQAAIRRSMEKLMGLLCGGCSWRSSGLCPTSGVPAGASKGGIRKGISSGSQSLGLSGGLVS